MAIALNISINYSPNQDAFFFPWASPRTESIALLAEPPVCSYMCFLFLIPSEQYPLEWCGPKCYPSERKIQINHNFGFPASHLNDFLCRSNVQRRRHQLNSKLPGRDEELQVWGCHVHVYTEYVALGLCSSSVAFMQPVLQHLLSRAPGGLERQCLMAGCWLGRVLVRRLLRSCGSSAKPFREQTCLFGFVVRESGGESLLSCHEKAAAGLALSAVRAPAPRPLAVRLRQHGDANVTM